MVGRTEVGALFDFRSVAVVGASPRNHYALSVLEGLETLGFEGEVVCIHPRAEPILGRPAYASLADVPHSLNAAVLIVGAEQVPALIEECAAAKIRAVTVISSGFAEAGGDGKGLQERLVEAARLHGIVVCGPNCLGYSAFHQRVSTYSRGDLPIRPGNVAVLSHSGGLLNEVLAYGDYRGIAFSYVVSTGNEAVLGLHDYLDFLVDDVNTEAIGLIIEGVRNPDRLRAAFEAAAASGKPVVAVKIGSSALAARAAATHTASMVGSAEVVAAVCRQAGVSLVPDVDALCEQLLLFSRAGGLLRSPRPPSGAAAIEISGGGKGLICDLAEQSGVPLPSLDRATVCRIGESLSRGAEVSNPLDMALPWDAPGSLDTHRACLEALGEDPGVEVVLSRLTVAPQGEIGSALAHGKAVAAAQRTHPDRLYAVLGRASDRIHPRWQELCAREGLPYLQGYARGLAAVGALLRYRRFLGSHGAQRPAAPRLPTTPRPWRPGTQRVLDEVAAKDLLEFAGLPVNPTRFAAGAAEAEAVAADVGFPAVLKGISPLAIHKTDLGLVELELADAVAVRKAAERILERLASLGDGGSAGRIGISVQSLVPSGAQVIVGGYRDELFGPVILCGPGGTWAELVADHALRLPPLDLRDAVELVGETRLPKLAAGFRNLPGFDVPSLAHFLVAVGDWFTARVDVREFDLNPVICRGTALVVVDARVVIDDDVGVEGEGGGA